MNHSESIGALAKALAEFQAEVSDPEKTKTARIQPRDQSKQAFSFPYADLLSMLEAARPLAAKHGLSIVQDVTCGEMRVHVSTIILHESGEFLELGPVSLPAQGDSKTWGGVITSARRYGLMPALGLATQGDDSGGAGSGGSGGSKKATSGQLAKIKGEAERGKVGVSRLRADAVKTYQLEPPKDVDLDSVLALLTIQQASNLIERLMAESDRRAAAKAAGVDPETGEVDDPQHSHHPDDIAAGNLPTDTERGQDGDDDIGFEGEDAPGTDGQAPGHDAASFKAKNEAAAAKPTGGML